MRAVAVATPALHGSAVLGISDNYSEALASEGGRARSYELDAVCRQSCALQLVSGILWTRRWVESLRNCTDSASRLADEGFLSPGELLVGKQIAHRI